jgi:hypothetical protein
MKGGTVQLHTKKRKEVGEIVVELTEHELEIICEEASNVSASEYVFERASRKRYENPGLLVYPSAANPKKC